MNSKVKILEKKAIKSRKKQPKQNSGFQKTIERYKRQQINKEKKSNSKIISEILKIANSFPKAEARIKIAEILNSYAEEREWPLLEIIKSREAERMRFFAATPPEDPNFLLNATVFLLKTGTELPGMRES